ncbi:MAG: AAA family ATPase [Bacteroidales bacterium]|nr:AAA family ATPase [Bacteroidales bacterium]
MLKRKISKKIEEYLKSDSNKMLIVDGARQIGKSYIIRYVGRKLFENYIEINMEDDRLNDRIFADANSVNKFYLALSSVAGEKMKDRQSTLVFIGEIQAYPHLFTLVKFLMQDRRFTYIASGSLLGVTLRKTQSIPIGSIQQIHMYPLDFEEFLWANDVGEMLIEEMHRCFIAKESLPEAIHKKIMGLFRQYLLVGGLPDAVNSFIAEHNIFNIRNIQNEVYGLYLEDAAKYEADSNRKLKIQRIYKMIPSSLESRKKRIVVKDIEGKAGKRSSDYQDEFDYLVSSGIALEVDAISQPTFPLIQNAGKNLLKLYVNDIGIFTGILYHNNIKPLLEDMRSINLDSVFETAVAQELKAHGHELFYYDSKKNGEVDYLINDYESLSAIPLEIKSGKDYTVHSALDRLLSVEDYAVKRAYVLSNEGNVSEKNSVTYMPVYNVMFF